MLSTFREDEKNKEALLLVHQLSLLGDEHKKLRKRGCMMGVPNKPQLRTKAVVYVQLCQGNHVAAAIFDWVLTYTEVATQFLFPTEVTDQELFDALDLLKKTNLVSWYTMEKKKIHLIPSSLSVSYIFLVSMKP